jgi:hypothetical protein
MYVCRYLYLIHMNVYTYICIYLYIYVYFCYDRVSGAEVEEEPVKPRIRGSAFGKFILLSIIKYTDYCLYHISIFILLFKFIGFVDFLQWYVFGHFELVVAFILS